MPRAGVERPRTRPDHVRADKAYTSRPNHLYLRRRGIRHTIPERLDQQRHRKPYIYLGTVTLAALAVWLRT
ncbi:hypothetical protein ACVWZD_006095 [Streptomyces sp. TE3672]